MYFLCFLVLQNGGIISKLHSIARGAEQRCNFLFQFFIPTQSIYPSLGRGRGMVVGLGGPSAGYIMLQCTPRQYCLYIFLCRQCQHTSPCKIHY